VITIDTHAIKENIMAKAELLKGNKAMAWGIMAIGGVFSWPPLAATLQP
jgi:Ni,Fe-hydrogenase III large subunit